MTGALLKAVPFSEHRNVTTAVAKAVTELSSKWHPMLKNQVKDLCGHSNDCAVDCVGETRWNSLPGCLASQLHIWEACHVFAVRHKQSEGFQKLHLCGRRAHFGATSKKESFSSTLSEMPHVCHSAQ